MKSQFIQKNFKTHRADRLRSALCPHLGTQASFNATGISGRKYIEKRLAGRFEALKARLKAWPGRQRSTALIAAFMAVTGNISTIEASQQAIPDAQLIQGASPDQLFGPDAETAPVLLSLNCRFPESILLGMPSFSGSDPMFNATMDVQSDGVIFVNGLPIEPVYKGSTDDGYLWYSMVSVVQVGIAVHGGVTDGMVMPDISNSQTAVRAQIQGGIYAMYLGDRRRMMAIDLMEEIVMFIDESDDGWINKLYARCQ